MMRRAWLVVVAVAGCQAAGPSHVTPPNQPDGDIDAAIDGKIPEVPIDTGPIDSPPDTPPPDLAALCGAQPVTFDDWERCYRKRWCEWEVGCLPLNTYRDVQECIDRSDAVEGGRLAAETRARKRAVEQGRATLDVAAFTRCLFDTSPSLCNTARFSIACATRFTGTVGDAGACYTDIDCTSPGAHCALPCSDACCLGSCQPRFRLGQACDLGDSCEPGLVCHTTCLSGDIGASCGANRDCDSNAWCNFGVCAADFALGAACTSVLQCGGQASCIGLTVSSSSPGHCQSISKPGDRCDYFCYGNLYCDGSGVCRELPGLGQSCSGLVPCGGVDTICSNGQSGQCVLRGDVGATCSTSQPCRPGLFCTSELNDPQPTCAAPRATGQPCASLSHCQSHLCSGTSGQPGACLAWSDSCPAGGG